VPGTVPAVHLHLLNTTIAPDNSAAARGSRRHRLQSSVLHGEPNFTFANRPGRSRAPRCRMFSPFGRSGSMYAPDRSVTQLHIFAWAGPCVHPGSPIRRPRAFCAGDDAAECLGITQPAVADNKKALVIVRHTTMRDLVVSIPTIAVLVFMCASLVRV